MKSFVFFFLITLVSLIAPLQSFSSETYKSDCMQALPGTYTSDKPVQYVPCGSKVTPMPMPIPKHNSEPVRNNTVSISKQETGAIHSLIKITASAKKLGCNLALGTVLEPESSPDKNYKPKYFDQYYCFGVQPPTANWDKTIKCALATCSALEGKCILPSYSNEGEKRYSSTLSCGKGGVEAILTSSNNPNIRNLEYYLRSHHPNPWFGFKRTFIHAVYEKDSKHLMQKYRPDYRLSAKQDLPPQLQPEAETKMCYSKTTSCEVVETACEGDSIYEAIRSEKVPIYLEKKNAYCRQHRHYLNDYMKFRTGPPIGAECDTFKKECRLKSRSCPSC